VNPRRLVWIGVSCGLGAIGVLLVGAVGSINAFPLQTIPLHQSSSSFEVSAMGDWIVASESRAMVDGIASVGKDVARQDLVLSNPLGKHVLLKEPARKITYAMPDRAGHIIGTFRASHSGQWTLEYADPTSEQGGMAIIAVGPDPAMSMVWWVMVPGVLAIVLLGVGAGCGWVAWRTRVQAYT
jgi:hypothetical protein